MKPEIWLILCDIRSLYNVGSIFRTADGAGLAGIMLAGITPYPRLPNDPRPPHIAARAHRQIAKTALGAELTVPFRHVPDPLEAIRELRTEGYEIAALEQSDGSVALHSYHVNASKLLLILGNEEKGLPTSVIDASDVILEIPMHGAKRSLNVAVAAGIAAYQLASE